MSGAVELEARITSYLSLGGLFNPEMANHDAVRDLLIDCRAEFATLRADNERLTDIEDQMREAWKWLRARDLVDDLDDEWDGFTAVLDHHEAEICEQAERAVARAEAVEAERDTLLAQVGRLREIIARYGDRMRMSYAPAHLQQDIDEAFTAETRAALTKEPSAGRSLLKENPNG